MYYHRLNAWKEGTSDKIIYLLKRTIRKYGKPLQILTDHGSQFYNSHSKLQSDFDSFYKEHGIQYVIGSIGKPTTRKNRDGIAHI